MTAPIDCSHSSTRRVHTAQGLSFRCDWCAQTWPMPARTSRPLRPWWGLGVVAVALATVFLVLLASGPAHATSTRAKTWAVSEAFCDGGVSTVWYASLTREQNEFRRDTQPAFDRQLSAIRELHYRAAAGRNHAFYELDWPNHCGGRS